jgi:hypothetical protein
VVFGLGLAWSLVIRVRSVLVKKVLIRKSLGHRRKIAPQGENFRYRSEKRFLVARGIPFQSWGGWGRGGIIAPQGFFFEI